MPHLTADGRLVDPTPIMAEVAQCVVLTGMPKCEATSITAAADRLAANPPAGRSVVIFNPRVRMTRQPPNAVPMLMAVAETRMAHTGI